MFSDRNESNKIVEYIDLDSWLLYIRQTESIGSSSRTMYYCPASQEWQWRHVLFTILSGTYNQ